MCSIQDNLRDKLLDMAESEYKVFTSRLLPGVDKIIGIRLPILRGLAKQILIEDWRMFVYEYKAIYFEEHMLKGMVIGYANVEADEKLDLISRFVPTINNWSVCDSFCSSLKFARKNKGAVWEFLQPYLRSDSEFQIRFAVVMLLTYYIEDEYIERVLKILERVNHQGYYVKMAVAWAVSVCYINYPERTLVFLKSNEMDKDIHNKAIQKICESRKVDISTKAMIRTYRR